MMRDYFRDELKKSMLERNQTRLRVIRMMLATLKDRDISVRSEDNREGISDDQILQMLQSMIKQRQESVTLYKKGERYDLVEQEENEIAVLKTFLPEPLSNEEIEAIICQMIHDEKASHVKDMGRLMGLLKTKYAGQMDFSMVGQLLKDHLKP